MLKHEVITFKRLLNFNKIAGAREVKAQLLQSKQRYKYS